MKVFQVALNSSDIAATLRLYSEAFGFQNAGATAVWGPIMQVQGLGPDARTLLWWLIGRQDFLQIEIFNHGEPKQRPLPADWRPSDIGWVRMGVAVGDFDHALKRLAALGVPLLSAPQTIEGARRTAIRDPYAGIIVEVIEDASPDASKGPAIAYVASSVSDLATAQRYYCETLGLPEISLDHARFPEDDRRWGLDDARRDAFAVQAGDVVLELQQYSQPAPRPKPADHRIVDQGIMNVGFGSRSIPEIASTLDRVKAAGHVPPLVFEGGGVIVGYVVDPERELEFAGVPMEMDRLFGFEFVGPFLGSAEM